MLHDLFLGAEGVVVAVVLIAALVTGLILWSRAQKNSRDGWDP